MEDMVRDLLSSFRQKRVFITGHTGFKGSWFIEFMKELGAEVAGYALPADTQPSHHALLKHNDSASNLGDLIEAEKLVSATNSFQPDILFHLAAQPLVRESYRDPVGTYRSNVMGTLNVLEACRQCRSIKAVVCITTDKVYENLEWVHPYREEDRLGGYDMYSSSKACCEILVQSYRNSFLNIAEFKESHSVLIATARAGNVIGGGDWSKDRLVPDMMRAAAVKNKVKIRNPHAIRPWQHVLDCLLGYSLIGTKLLNQDVEFAGSWNFAPHVSETKSVIEVFEFARKHWDDLTYEADPGNGNYHEAKLLKLDNSKALVQLGWRPVWNTEQAIEKTVEWYKSYYRDGNVITRQQINQYLNS